MKTFLKIVLIVLAYFTPVAPMILATIIFCVADFVTGTCCAIRFGKLDSKKMKHKAWDLFFYIGAIVLSFIFSALFRSWYDFPLYKVTAFIILSIEFWSNMENISKLTGIPLLSKGKFFETVDKLKNLGADQPAKPEDNDN
jgi:hypothetical protein